MLSGSPPEKIVAPAAPGALQPPLPKLAPPVLSDSSGLVPPNSARPSSNQRFARIQAGGATIIFPGSTPRYLEGKGKPEHPFPYYRPLAGKDGGVLPGSQYWEHPPDLGPWESDALNSTTMRTFKKTPEAARNVDSFCTRGHGSGTGFGANYSSIKGTDWSYPATGDDLRTTYSREMKNGWFSSRKRWANAACTGSALHSVAQAQSRSASAPGRQVFSSAVALRGAPTVLTASCAGDVSAGPEAATGSQASWADLRPAGFLGR